MCLHGIFLNPIHIYTCFLHPIADSMIMNEFKMLSLKFDSQCQILETVVSEQQQNKLERGPIYTHYHNERKRKLIP